MIALVSSWTLAVQRGPAGLPNLCAFLRGKNAGSPEMRAILRGVSLGSFKRTRKNPAFCTVID